MKSIAVLLKILGPVAGVALQNIFIRAKSKLTHSLSNFLRILQQTIQMSAPQEPWNEKFYDKIFLTKPNNE
jgi:hypothetical protein